MSRGTETPGQHRGSPERDQPGMWKAEASLPAPFHSLRWPQLPAGLRRGLRGRHVWRGEGEETTGVFKTTPRLLDFFLIPFCHLLYLKCHLLAPITSILPAVPSPGHPLCLRPPPSLLCSRDHDSPGLIPTESAEEDEQLGSRPRNGPARGEPAGSMERFVACLGS